MFKIALIFGGPSAERGISLNSARSVLDHLSSESIEILPLYVDSKKNFYAISASQLYSNTPSDFDFKLSATASHLGMDELRTFLNSVNFVFPAIHGPFGEDGELQELLEEAGVPFIGSGSLACRRMFCKDTAANFLRLHGLPTLPSLVLPFDREEAYSQSKHFFETNQLKKAIIKPAIGGSSIGVFSVSTPEEALEKAGQLFEEQPSRKILLEAFCHGREFTVMVFENLLNGIPVALIPTEIELHPDAGPIFDYRKKYLPTNQTVYHTPPRFEDDIIQSIRTEAKALFKLFGMRDFARMDGWLMPDGTLYFTDINPISGLEQNSFLFRQATLLGMSHREVLYSIVGHACRRWQIPLPALKKNDVIHQNPVHIVFGGKSAERQVSLMSGTNVWLKLLKSNLFNPSPFLFDKEGFIWKLPYSYALDHTVEEIYERCCRSGWIEKVEKFIKIIQEELKIPFITGELPLKVSLEEFLQLSKERRAFVFIALHGGEGENGVFQKKLENFGLKYNGSNAMVSHLCMDKFLTGERINQLGEDAVTSLPKFCIGIDAFNQLAEGNINAYWNKLCQKLHWDSGFIIKPRQDGCSAGVVYIGSASDLLLYASLVVNKSVSVLPGTFWNQLEIIEMSPESVDFIVEPYIEVDRIAIESNALSYTPKTGWLELTAGVLEKNGTYFCLNPSITLAAGAVLGLEEKFQGGTGINLTPPPPGIMSSEIIEVIKKLIEKAAKGLNIENYARIDVFFNIHTKKLVVIEANTLPAMTPSTVIYHQALAENPPLTPLALIETIISSRIANAPI
ncbi:MAG: hypothetical protein H0V82_00060 [Candidatus Protochlamydia sp.]|nr:hypothetical protein [Candidatus Protochlamydia sp.]